MRAARAATARNMMATLLFSQGIPMITAGDELLRSQEGNNNAYCQDNRLSWVDWRLTPLDRSMLRTTQRLIRIRRAFLVSQPRDFPTRPRDVVLNWYASSGEPMSDDLWQTDGVRALQIVIGARGGDLAGLFVLNGTASPVAAVLPRFENLAGSDVEGASYRLVLATDPQLDELTGNRWRAGEELTVPAQSIAMFAIA